MKFEESKNQGSTWADLEKALPERERPMVGYTGLKVTWRQLVAIEPRLKDLFKEIKAVKDTGGPSFCANRIWYGNNPKYPNFKGKMIHLVGWEAEKDDPILDSPEAYDLAYRKLYDVLPPCRNCQCV